MVVGHSYGGTPSLYAIGVDLWKSKEGADGKTGVLRAILLCSSFTLPGGSVAGDREEYKAKHGGVDDGDVKIEAHGNVSRACYASIQRKRF